MLFTEDPEPSFLFTNCLANDAVVRKKVLPSDLEHTLVFKTPAKI